MVFMSIVFHSGLMRLHSGFINFTGSANENRIIQILIGKTRKQIAKKC